MLFEVVEFKIYHLETISVSNEPDLGYLVNR